METKIDTYKHLNEDDDGVKVGIEEIARQIVPLNYGTHRLLSAVVRCRRARSKAQAEKYQDDTYLQDELADEIEKLLNRGLT